MAEPYFIYKTWTVYVSDEYSDTDVIKYTYYAVHILHGTRKEIDVSPYGLVPPSVIKRIIDLDFPSRVGSSPLTLKDLDSLEQFQHVFKGAAE